ncbi:MAG: hypothetical protein ABSG83_15910 [Roseiarcus sp.]|jgi:hypothetical protein
MLMRKIVHSCTNVHVAHAAVVSIGGDFATAFAEEAARRAMSPGVLAAQMVAKFSACAADEDRGGLDAAARDSDQPILSGLRYILSRPALAG